MIKLNKTKIRDVIHVLRKMSLHYRLQMRYETHQKYIRDQMAREDYVRDEGRMEGIQALVETCQELGLSKEETSTRLGKKIPLSETEISQYTELYWK